MSKFQKLLWAGLLFASLLSCVGAPFPNQLYLQHIPTAFVLVILPLARRRYPLTDGAFACIVVFMLIHVLGARYIYSCVPYDEWTERLFGFNLTRQFHFQRNHYDRLVHFMFGLLIAHPVWEVLTRFCEIPRRYSRYGAVEFILASSLVYEVFEWGLTILLSPEDAGTYNGQQGDLWDAQKDMCLALIGALLWASISSLAAKRHAEI